MTDEIAKANLALAKGRVTVEQYFGRIKKWGLLSNSQSIPTSALKYFEMHLKCIYYFANKFGKKFQF